MKNSALRVIDANLNRTREGLRVCEEVARFVLNNKPLTKELKNARHRIQDICGSFPNGWKRVLASRDSTADVGRQPSFVEFRRKNTNEIFFANMQRAKESARVLEEFLKLFDYRLSNRFKRLRFGLYEIERKTLKKL